MSFDKFLAFSIVVLIITYCIYISVIYYQNVPNDDLYFEPRLLVFNCKGTNVDAELNFTFDINNSLVLEPEGFSQMGIKTYISGANQIDFYNENLELKNYMLAPNGILNACNLDYFNGRCELYQCSELSDTGFIKSESSAE